MVSILLEPGPDAEPIRERVESPGENLHVPHLLNIQVLNVLRRQTLRGILAEERGATVLQDLESIRMIRYLTSRSSNVSGICGETSPPTARPTSHSPRR